jgi:hypothetical protein
MNVPNLFSFATKELSQDAFLCWLLQWSDASYAEIEPKLHIAGQSLLNRMFIKHGITLNILPSVKIIRQFKNVDILVEVDSQYILLIEDKTTSKEHSNQLARYKEDVCKAYPEQRVLPIFFKTGEQSDYRDVEKQGYALILREDLLAILRDGIKAGIENAIFRDFLDYLEQWEGRIQSYKTAVISDWQLSGDAWIGLYKELQRHKKDLCWDYVPNQNGGFMGAWWQWHKKPGFHAYLQIEQGDLCFKIEVDAEVDKAAIRHKWHTILSETAASQEIMFKKNRFGLGKTMTVAKIDAKEWLADTDSGHLDLEKTLINLGRMEELMRESAAKL